MKKDHPFSNKEFALIGCMYTGPGVSHGSPGRPHKCVGCKRDVHLSFATGRDVAERGLRAAPMCFPCLAEKAKNGEKLGHGNVGKHTLFALLQAIKKTDN